MTNMEHEVRKVMADHMDPIPVTIVDDITENVHDVAARWAPHTFGVGPGMPPFPIAGKNPQRKRLCVFTDAGNTGPVLLSASNTGAPSLALQPGSALLEMTHTDSVYVTSLTTAVVYAFEEMYT